LSAVTGLEAWRRVVVPVMMGFLATVVNTPVGIMVHLSKTLLAHARTDTWANSANFLQCPGTTRTSCNEGELTSQRPMSSLVPQINGTTVATSVSLQSARPTARVLPPRVLPPCTPCISGVETVLFRVPGYYWMVGFSWMVGYDSDGNAYCEPAGIFMATSSCMVPDTCGDSWPSLNVTRG
jgi:hypothetical protein